MAKEKTTSKLSKEKALEIVLHGGFAPDELAWIAEKLADVARSSLTRYTHTG